MKTRHILGIGLLTALALSVLGLAIYTKKNPAKPLQTKADNNNSILIFDNQMDDRIDYPGDYEINDNYNNLTNHHYITYEIEYKYEIILDQSLPKYKISGETTLSAIYYNIQDTNEVEILINSTKKLPLLYISNEPITSPLELVILLSSITTNPLTHNTEIRYGYELIYPGYDIELTNNNSYFLMTYTENELEIWIDDNLTTNYNYVTYAKKSASTGIVSDDINTEYFTLPTEYTTGYTAGYNAGYTAGETTGYNTGYTAGYNTGYGIGYNDSDAFNHPIDLIPTMLTVLTMPFTFISQAFDVTLWPGTQYQINIGNFIKAMLAISAILFIIKLFTSGFSIIGNYTSNHANTQLKRSQTKLNKAKTKQIEGKK